MSWKRNGNAAETLLKSSEASEAKRCDSSLTSPIHLQYISNISDTCDPSDPRAILWYLVYKIVSRVSVSRCVSVLESRCSSWPLPSQWWTLHRIACPWFQWTPGSQGNWWRLRLRIETLKQRLLTETSHRDFSQCWNGLRDQPICRVLRMKPWRLSTKLCLTCKRYSMYSLHLPTKPTVLQSLQSSDFSTMVATSQGSQGTDGNQTGSNASRCNCRSDVHSAFVLAGLALVLEVFHLGNTMKYQKVYHHKQQNTEAHRKSQGITTIYRHFQTVCESSLLFLEVQLTSCQRKWKYRVEPQNFVDGSLPTYPLLTLLFSMLGIIHKTHLFSQNGVSQNVSLLDSVGTWSYILECILLYISLVKIVSHRFLIQCFIRRDMLLALVCSKLPRGWTVFHGESHHHSRLCQTCSCLLSVQAASSALPLLLVAVLPQIQTQIGFE